MNQEIRNYVMQKMSPFLDNGQTLRLERILEEVQLKQENGSDYEEDNAELLEKFIAAKRLEGRSDGTLNYYQFYEVYKDDKFVTTLLTQILSYIFLMFLPMSSNIFSIVN